MSLVWAAYVTIPIVTFVVSSLLAYWVSADRSEVPGSKWFVATLAATSLWMVFHVVMLVAGNPEVQLLAHELGTKTATASFLTFALFASRYSRSNFHRHPLGALAVGTVVAILLLPTFLDTFTDFLYRSRTVVTQPFPYVATEPGIPFVGLLLVPLSLTAVGLFALLRYLLSTPRNSGAQLVLLIVGGLSIPLVTVLGDVGAFPARGLNHAGYGTLGFVACVSLALFWYRLFELQPVARNAVVEQLQDPVLVLDRDRRLADYNAAAGALLPDAAGATGTPFSTVHPELAEAVRDAEHAGGAKRVSMPVDGGSRHYSVNVSIVGDADAPDWYSIVLRDVTDLEQSRWQLATQNERLDQVASTISHDLRNPINVADGYADMLAERFETTDPADLDAAELQEFLGKIRHSHDRMLDIIQDILTIAREGKTVEETAELHLDAVARDAWENVDTGDATLTVTSDGPIEADRSKLLTVFENLFRNAIDHVGGDVAVEVGLTADGFFVADDGPGIDPNNREQVFEYGYSTGSGGTGLGLSIVRTMAESHGWTVALDDGFADGARFVFRLGPGERDDAREDSTNVGPPSPTGDGGAAREPLG